MSQGKLYFTYTRIFVFVFRIAHPIVRTSHLIRVGPVPKPAADSSKTWIDATVSPPPICLGYATGNNTTTLILSSDAYGINNVRRTVLERSTCRTWWNAAVFVLDTVPHDVRGHKSDTYACPPAVREGSETFRVSPAKRVSFARVYLFVRDATTLSRLVAFQNGKYAPLVRIWWWPQYNNVRYGPIKPEREGCAFSTPVRSEPRRSNIFDKCPRADVDIYTRGKKKKGYDRVCGIGRRDSRHSYVYIQYHA